MGPGQILPVLLRKSGAEGGDRTRTGLRPQDFKSCGNASHTWSQPIFINRKFPEWAPMSARDGRMATNGHTARPPGSATFPTSRPLISSVVHARRSNSCQRVQRVAFSQMPGGAPDIRGWDEGSTACEAYTYAL